MRLHGFALAAVLASFVTAPASGQQQSVTIDNDDITLRGCIRQGAAAKSIPSMLVWSRSDIMMVVGMNEPNPVAGLNPATRVFYWLDDEEDLAKHVGQMVEVKGELEDFERGEVEIKRDGDYTEIELDLGGKEEKIRVPSSWLGQPPARDQEYEIMGRRIDVEEIKVVGACPAL